MSDRSDAHALLSQDFVDVWRVGGSGFGMTHPNWSVIAPPFGFLPALLRPDYIFVDPEIGILGAQVITAGRSDHFPVQARLTFVER